MLYSNKFLKLCSTAKEYGYPLKVDVGSFVGRGFADIGLELFSCLPGSKLLSLLTGQIVPYVKEDDKHLFSVPNVDQILSELEAYGVVIDELKRVDSRNWHVTLCDIGGKYYKLEDEDLLSLFINAYCEVKKNV